jgi:hypothetical protein
LLFKLSLLNGSYVAGLGRVANLWAFFYLTAWDVLAAGFYMDNVARRHTCPILLSLQTGLPARTFRYQSSLPAKARGFDLENVLRQLSREGHQFLTPAPFNFSAA